MISPRDALYAELKLIREEMAGISPKLQIHKDLKKKLDAIKEQLGGQSMPPNRWEGQFKFGKEQKVYFSKYHKI